MHGAFVQVLVHGLHQAHKLSAGTRLGQARLLLRLDARLPGGDGAELALQVVAKIRHAVLAKIVLHFESINQNMKTEREDG